MSKRYDSDTAASSPRARSDERSVQQKPTERAFVIQFDPVTHARCRLRGRAEVVASGETTRFRSVKELVAFIVGALHKRPASPSED